MYVYVNVYVIANIYISMYRYIYIFLYLTISWCVFVSPPALLSRNSPFCVLAGQVCSVAAVLQFLLADSFPSLLPAPLLRHISLIA